MIEETDERERVIRALTRRAIGYTTEEIIEEYSFEEGKALLTKRKVASKEYPPDLSAINTLLELLQDKKKVSDLTDEELKKERKRLLEELRKEEKIDDKVEGQIKMDLEVSSGS